MAIFDKLHPSIVLAYKDQAWDGVINGKHNVAYMNAAITYCLNEHRTIMSAIKWHKRRFHEYLDECMTFAVRRFNPDARVNYDFDYNELYGKLLKERPITEDFIYNIEVYPSLDGSFFKELSVCPHDSEKEIVCLRIHQHGNEFSVTMER